MPPVAQKPALYEQGTPQRELQNAVAVRFPHAEDFFEKLAETLTIRQDSASGTYYAFLKGTRQLPATHRTVYLDELGIAPETLDAISARSVTTQPQRDLLGGLEATIAEVARVQALLLDELALVVDEQGQLASRPSPGRGPTKLGA